MGKAFLVDRDIEDGKRIVDLLVRSGEKVPVALWLFDAERGAWQLVLAVPQMARSPQEAYNFLQNVLKDMGKSVQLTLQDITLISPDADLTKSLLKEKKSARALADQFLSGTRIGDAFLDAAYLYKVA